MTIALIGLGAVPAAVALVAILLVANSTWWHRKYHRQDKDLVGCDRCLAEWHKAHLGRSEKEWL